jgi:hypothetical protein
VNVYDVGYEPPRPEIVHEGADKLIAHEATLSPLNKGTCVSYALGSMGEAIDYTATLPDGAKLTMEGSKLNTGEGPAKLTITTADNKQQTIVADGGDSCVQFSRDWKQMVLMRNDEDKAELYDFDKVRESGSLAGAKIGELPQKLSVAFPLDNGDLIAATWGEPVRRWHRDAAAGTWSSKEIYSGDDPVFYAEPDVTGNRLLLLENTGGGGVQGVLYSVPARERWMELGNDYKWFGEAFSDDGGIAAGAREVQTFIRLSTLSELVKETEGRVAAACAPAAGFDYRTSPCWPDWLR